MRKILFVVDERKLGGVSIALENILNNLKYKNYKVDLLVLHENGKSLKNIPANINVLNGTKFFDVIDISLKKALKAKKIKLVLKKIYLILLMESGFIIRKVKKERKKILSDQYDVEIAFKDGFCAIFTACGNANYKVHWLHSYYEKDDPNSKYSKLFQNLFSKFNLIVAVSKSVLDSFEKKYKFDAETKVIGNILDVKSITEKSKEAVTDLKKGEITFVSVGRLDYIKGYRRLIKVFGRLKQENKLGSVTLNIIGNGPEYDSLIREIAIQKLEKNVFLLGEKMNPYKYMKKADLFLLSSYSESFGLVVVESMLVKTPVLHTNIKPVNEIVGEKGIKAANSAEGLYKAISEVLKNKKIIKQKQKHIASYNYENNKIIKEIEVILGDKND